MKSASSRHRSVAQRLVLASVSMLAVVLLIVSTIMSVIAERESRQRIAESVAEKAQSVANSIDAFDATSRALAERAFAPFREQFDPAMVQEEATGKLLSFGVALNDDHSAVDKFAKDTGGVAAIFARKADVFVPIATSIKTDAGARAQGAVLDAAHPAYQPVLAAKTYVAREVLSGRAYMTLYQPVRDAAGKVIGVLSIGVDVSGFQSSLDKLVAQVKLFETGGAYVIEQRTPLQQSIFVSHPTAKGQAVSTAYPKATALLAALVAAPLGSVGDVGSVLGASPDQRWAVLRKAKTADWWVVAEVSDSEAMQQHWLTMYVQWGLLTLTTLLLGAGVYALVRRYVSQPLHELTAAVGSVAQGDLTQAFSTTRGDEIGALVDQVEGMRQRYLQALTQVRQAVDSIGGASAEIASGNQDLSGRTEQTASNLQRTAASMGQLTGTVSQSAQAAAQANQLAASAAAVAARGGVVVGQVVSTMQEINQSSRQIADIISVIDGIAFQTNILALNAAVEAARAGEQGRGFAVVASEVRSLAQRSAEAAKEIKVLIGASVQRVESGSRLVQEAGVTMEEIVRSVRRVSDIIGEVTAASSEQSHGIGEVNAAIGQLDSMTQQNAALVEQSAAAAHSLAEQAQRLAQAVSVFRLGSSPPVALKPPARPARLQQAARAPLPRLPGAGKPSLRALPSPGQRR